jgi:nucleoside-diphosphate-sugar epimerase
MKALILGGSGVIGRHVAACLAEEATRNAQHGRVGDRLKIAYDRMKLAEEGRRS